MEWNGVTGVARHRSRCVSICFWSNKICDLTNRPKTSKFFGSFLETSGISRAISGKSRLVKYII